MTNKYDLHSAEWGKFIIWQEFNITATSSWIDKNKLNAKKWEIPYITRTDANNGIDEYIWIQERYQMNKWNVISIWLDTQTVFYQQADFYTGQNLQILTHKKLNKCTAQFLILLLKIQLRKFSWWSNGATLGRLKKTKLLLPKNKTWNPDWDFMEGYMREKEKRQLEIALSYYKKKLWDKNVWEMILKNCAWRAFEIGSLFSLSQWKSKWLNHLEIDASGVNYLGATNRNNGVMCQVQKNEKMVQKWNCIAFIRNGEWSMWYSVYKAEDFIATSDISVWYSDFLTQNIWLFITTVADRVRGKYNFWYKRSDTRLKKEKILLPANSKWEPDWKFIEQYMQHQEQKLVKKYIDFAENKSI